MQYAIVASFVAMICVSYDLRYHRIPNFVAGYGFFVGVLLHAIFSGMAGAAYAVLAGLCVGMIFLPFYIVGGMGAGDVKMMAALGSIYGFFFIVPLCLISVITGGLSAVCLSLAKRKSEELLTHTAILLRHHRRYGLRPHGELNLNNKDAIKLPFAIPACLTCFSLLAYQVIQ